MPKFDNKYTLGFIGIVALVCALLLSVAATALKSRQEANVVIDKKRNILKAFQILPDKAKPQQILDIYASQVVELVVNAAGEEVAGEEAFKLNPREEERKPEAEQLYPLFVLKDAQGEVAGYAVPIFGKGLWSTLYGYIALERDATTVLGITYYQHGETPGLGAEVDASWFTAMFPGKRTLDQSGTLRSVTLVKGHAADKYHEPELSHYVDAISGATITSSGVTAMLKKDLAKYEPYFRKVRKGAHHG
jgi:Na+-transporting NADH:ubiquinone oxidoreductase subunit C